MIATIRMTTSTVVVDDGDCDGVLTADDCDDADAGSTTVVAEDADCDGVLTVDDWICKCLISQY